MQYVQNTEQINALATGSTAGTALQANNARVYWQIQNVGTNPIYLLWGSGTASSTNCNEVLKSDTSALAGAGGIYRSGTVVYDGAVSVGGTAPTYIAFDMTP